MNDTKLKQKKTKIVVLLLKLPWWFYFADGGLSFLSFFRKLRKIKIIPENPACRGVAKLSEAGLILSK